MSYPLNDESAYDADTVAYMAYFGNKKACL